MRHKVLLGASAALLMAVVAAPSMYGKKKKMAAPVAPAIAQISADEKVLHVLNRLTFGPRPGDVERVKALGVDKFIEEQLHPEAIAENAALEARLAPLDTLHMSTSEMADRYPPQQAVKAMVDGRLPYPTDPETRRMIEKLVARYKDKKGVDVAAANAKPGDEKPDPEALMKAASKLTPEQQRIFRGGTPQEKTALVEALPADQQYDLLEAIGGRRQGLMMTASPELRRKIEKMNGPQFVVYQDLFENKLLRATYSNRQLDEVLTDFWYNHFNIFLDKGADRYLVTAYERDAIRPNVLGKFKDLLVATAKSPAMLFYLDNTQSVSPNMQQRPNAKVKRGLNENYGRELMELHTLGVDGGYTQKDVTEVARCFTGWGVRDARGAGTFFFNERAHDQGEKNVLGHVIPAGGGMNDGLMVLDILAKHPSTAKFIAKSLAIRFVSDEPPAALVDRMAQTFTATDGDLRAVMETMFKAPEFWSRDTYRAKLKSPFEMVVSALRATNGDVNATFAITQQLNQLGEPLYRKQEPTGYSNKSSDWVNSASLLARMNFALALTNNKVPGIKVDLSNLPQGDPMNTARALLMTELSSEARTVIAQGLADQSGKTPPAALVAGLALGSPDFQRR